MCGGQERNRLYSIGVDIGGTKVAIAIVEDSGQIMEQVVIPTNLSIPPEQMIEIMVQKINELLQMLNITETDIKGIGIGAPGPLDNNVGIIKNPPNLRNWIDVPIKQLFKQAFQLPVFVDNDANAATLAELKFGAGRDSDHFVFMTVSTGVGSGIVADGNLLRGKNGSAGEIGHIVVDPSFGPCICGQQGCLESIASGTAIAKQGSKIIGKELTTKEVFELYELGNPEIVSYLNKVFRVLGTACVTLINTFDTEKIVIGGGVSKVGEPFFKPIQEYVRQTALSQEGRNTVIVPAQLSQDAGVIGAAALCFE